QRRQRNRLVEVCRNWIGGHRPRARSASAATRPLRGSDRRPAAGFKPTRKSTQSLRRPMHKTPKSPVDKVVFWGAVVISASLVAGGAIWPKGLSTAAQALLDKIIDWFGWSFVLSTAFFLGFALFLAFSRF